ncbi:MAG TPA: hypothetical protein VG268_03465, partial [Streptosporangiaceae bacterium]|nr:hypothetical protein [Streptosporangiaceae bacterium]
AAGPGWVAAVTAGVVGCATAVTADPATEPTAWTAPLGLGVAAAGAGADWPVAGGEAGADGAEVGCAGAAAGAAVLALGAAVVVPWVSVEPTA